MGGQWIQNLREVFSISTEISELSCQVSYQGLMIGSKIQIFYSRGCESCEYGPFSGLSGGLLCFSCGGAAKPEHPSNQKILASTTI